MDDLTATGDSSDPIARIEQKMASGEVSREEIERARALWRARLHDGVIMPHGERIMISARDLHHVLEDSRIRRKPERIERLLGGVFDIRTARSGRRMGLSEWVEGGEAVRGYVIVDDESHVRTMHLLDARGLRKKARRGERLWRRHE
ncbi:MAG: hypothetical protein ACRDJH_06820 [Thermomicrobiales bacterium]